MSKAIKIEKLDVKKLPEAVSRAYGDAQQWIAERFRGRRLLPEPTIVQLPIPEEGEEAVLHAILVPTGQTGRERLTKSAAALAQARDKSADALVAAMESVNNVAIVEMCFWVEGQPDTGEGPRTDSRVRARDFLKTLRDEPGSLGGAFEAISDAASKLLLQPEVRLGKL